jgi:hypothetical protein
MVLPSYSKQGGPLNWPHVTFDRAQDQFLDAGSRTFKIGTGGGRDMGGLTIVAVVKFTGPVPGYEIWETLVSAPNRGLKLGRGRGPDKIDFEIDYSNTRCLCRSKSVLADKQDKWITIVARYTTKYKTMSIEVDGESACTISCNRDPALEPCTGYCGSEGVHDVTDLTLSNVYLGKKLTGQVAGLYIVDVYLNDWRAAEVSERIHAGLQPIYGLPL